jgi:hypothetical protein
MRLYVANLTKQYYKFMWSIPEHFGQSRQTIPMGSQICLSNVELSTPDIDYIVRKHARYGFVKIEEIDTAKGYVGLVYSIDKPVDAVTIERVMRRNSLVMNDRGKKIRQEAAVAESQRIDTQLVEADRPPLRRFESSVVVENPDTSAEGAPIAEGIRVVKDPTQEQMQGQ